MDWSSALGPIASLGGSVISGVFGQNSAEDAFNHQKSLFYMQNAANIANYKHRYQWATQDMRSAGLNPILAATQGVGGNVQGASVPSTAMAPTPDFASAFNSAFQTSSQKEIAKMQNQIAKQELELKDRDVTSAIQKRQQDMDIARARFELDKMVQEAAVKRADALNSAQIQNMKDRLEAEKEHWERQDLNGAAMASAAMASANAAGLQAMVAQELGISKQAVMEAERAYIGLQSDNAVEALKWQQWLNDHEYTRGAVGFLGSIFDTVGLVRRGTGLAKEFSGLGD